MEQSEIRRIGRILKERRLQLGYTQEYAAEKAGISYSYYTKIERGQQLHLWKLPWSFPKPSACLWIAGFYARRMITGCHRLP